MNNLSKIKLDEFELNEIINNHAEWLDWFYNGGELKGKRAEFKELYMEELRLKTITSNPINLKYAVFENVFIEKASFSKIDFQGAEFRNVTFKKAYIEDCILKGASFIDANLLNANINGKYHHPIVGFKGISSFETCELIRTNLSFSKISCVSFEEAILIDVNLEGVEFDEVCCWRARCRNVNFKNSYLKNKNRKRIAKPLFTDCTVLCLN